MHRLKIILIVIILIFGLFLKLHNYSIYPQRGASSDEYTYAFLGISLLKEDMPISWSAFTPYKNKYDLTINKLYFPMVYPYFDHPPLNGFLVGGWSILFGEDTFTKVELKTIRLVPIILSMISSILVFLLGLKIYDYKTAIWALLIYTTTTIFVMNNRVVFAENLLTPLFLGALYLFCIYKKHITNAKAAIIGLICGLCVLTKELGIAVFLSMLYLFIDERIRVKQILLLGSIFVFISGIYILYGFYYDKELFLQIISMQSNRSIGPQTLTYILSTPIIVNKIFYDGWYFFGFFSILFSLHDYKKNKMIIVPAAIYLFFLLFSLTRQGEMGWYIIPLFPFMALASAHVLVEGIKEYNWSIFIMLLFVGLSQIKLLYEDIFGLTPMQFRVQLIIIFVPLVILFLLQKKRMFGLLAQVWFYLLIIGNILITYNYVHPA